MIVWKFEDLPFFDNAHRDLAGKLENLQGELIALEEDAHRLPLGDACRMVLKHLGDWDLLQHAVPRRGRDDLSLRSICLVREALGFSSTLADTMFSMQGIGMAPIWQNGSVALQERYLDACRKGEKIAAFALTEPDSGSDVASIRTRGVKDGADFVLEGAKAWISNGGIADHYVVVVRTEPVEGSRGLTAFMVDAGTTGFEPGPQLDMIAPHPLSHIAIRGARVPATFMVGPQGGGFKVAMATFDIFRASVGAAALGMARRALAESLVRINQRHLFGKSMSQMDGVQTKIGEMATDVDSASLMVYRAAWIFDKGSEKPAKAVSMAKFIATEAAQRVIDNAVQLFGGAGVERGHIIEKLYRDVRPTRIYEGASEVQKLVIARNVIASAK
jgi:acyl-CoA dehydrogenase